MRALLLATLLAVPCAPALGADEPDPKAAIQRFGGELKSALLAAMETQGPVGAITVCGEMAPEIAAEVEARTGVTVRRTAFRVRNPGNRPDAQDRADLSAIEAALDAGEEPDSIVIRHENRIAKPIMTGGLCLACHGPDIAPPVQAALDQRYPEDEATGFEEGALRGAFIATW